MKTPLRSLLLCFALVIGQLALVAKPPDGKGPKDRGSDDGEQTAELDHKGLQTGLIQMGTSGGWGDDIANGYCCGGTLGSLVKDGSGNVYILSNYHVLAADIFPGGDGKIVTLDSPVIHPALIDVRCDASSSVAVAGFAQAALPLVDANTHNTSLYVKGNVDAAIALVEPNVVDESGSILGIGELSSYTVEAFPGQAVKKSGRTTGFTRSSVSGFAATIRVAYENECAGDSIGTAVFENQIVVENKGSKFLSSGDSGSLMVEDLDVTPRAVGLLFAGSKTAAIANPIQEVLDTFGGLEMVGIATVSAEASTQSATGPGGSSASQFGQARAAQARASASLMGINGVIGHGLGVGPNGMPVIKLYVEALADFDRSNAPAFIDGVRVVVEEIGTIVAF